MTEFWRTFDGTMKGTYRDPNWSNTFWEVFEMVTYKDGYGLLLAKDKRDPQGRWYFQVECERPDVFTGEPGIGRGGKYYLSPVQTKTELVQALFGLFQAYEIHECREWFKYRERAVFGPHIDINAHWEVAERLSFREPADESTRSG